MALFDLFKKKEQFDEQTVLNELKAFSKQAIELAKPEISETGSFLPFGVVLTTDDVFEMVVYVNPESKTIDYRKHLTIIQNLIKKKSKDSRCKLALMAFDGIAHLPTGDIDAILVQVAHRRSRINRLLTYPYKIADKKVQLQDVENPVVKNI
jgi:hypothetical protein